MIRVVYIISRIDKALAFEWINDFLDKSKFEISFILLGDEKSAFIDYLKIKKTPFLAVRYSSKKDILSAFFNVLLLLRTQKPHIVHTHLFDANIIGLSAAWLSGVKRRIFTRHHATLHYDQYPSGVKWDKLCNWLATDIIAISKNVQKILIERDGALPSKIKLIHHGFILNYFESLAMDRVTQLKNKLGMTSKMYPVVGVIARYTDWKGIQFILPAFEKMRQRYPESHLVLANAHGDYRDIIQGYLKKLPAGSCTEVLFENDLAALYHLFDVYIHVPFNSDVEAFGQTYVESLAAGIPSIFTMSGIAPEFIESGENALVVKFANSEDIFEALVTITESKTIRERLIRKGKESVQRFNLKNHITKLEALYSDAERD